METIGLIAAMPQESAALLRQVKGWKRISVGAFRGYSFELSGRTCILGTSGMGLRRASEATRKLIESYSPILVISFGIAGAVEADLEIGDVVAIEAVRRLEQGVLSAPNPLNPLRDTVWQTAGQVLARRGAHLYPGTAITTGGSPVSEDLLAGTTHPVLEMETAGIEKITSEKGIPLAAIRAISDGPCAPIPFDLTEIMDQDANLRADKILTAIAHNPRIMLQFSRSMRNSKLAADNAAAAVLAVLS